MSDATTVRPNAKPSHAPFGDLELLITDHPESGIGATPWPEFRTQLLEICAGVVAEARLAGFTWEEVADATARAAIEVTQDQVGRRIVYTRAEDKAYVPNAPGSGPALWQPVSTLKVAWADLPGKPSTYPTTVDTITDASTLGKGLLKAASAGEARATIEGPVSTGDYAATETIDLSVPSWRIVDLTGNVTVAFANIALGAESHRVLRAGAADRTITFPACKLPDGVLSPLTLKANTWAVLSAKSFGTSSTNIALGVAIFK